MPTIYVERANGRWEAFMYTENGKTISSGETKLEAVRRCAIHTGYRAGEYRFIECK